MNRKSKLLTLVFALVLSLTASFTSFADPPVCNPYCVTSQCSSHSDCTAQPNGHCDFACPGVGCCVYS